MIIILRKKMEIDPEIKKMLPLHTEFEVSNFKIHFQLSLDE